MPPGAVGAGERTDVQFGVLGPLCVTAEGAEPVVVTAPRLRVLLAVLLWRAGRPVPADELADLVWDGSPPGGAVTTLRAMVMRLRRVIGEAAGARIVTRPPGYMIQLSAGELDASCFEALSREAGTAAAADRWAQAAQAAGQALGLWRGTPLADVPSQLLRDRWVPSLEQARVQVLEWRIEADLHQGRHEQLTGELIELTRQHPLRERFHGQLMVALVRCGRQAEALAAYQQARKLMVEELGTEPGTGLRGLHQQVLTGDPALTLPGTMAVAGSRPAMAVPRELPGPVAGFTGRGGELAALTGLLDQPAGEIPEAVVISAIGGTAGVGKTALAVQWAHRVANRFPDGQLYVNLRGYDPDRPLPAADALAGFLLSLGVPGQDIPPEEEQRAARYRSLLAGKKVLVVLDNAGSAEQVRPLLPGTPGCMVVVTSRDSLAGVVARHGATRLELDLLPLPDAVGLLRELIGPRIEADPGAADKLAGQCCRLPLALRVAAERASARPDAPMAGLVVELADQRRRLDLLQAGGDPRTAVRAVFSWSYRHLDDDTARAFRLAGLHPGPDVDPYAAAALTGMTLSQARTVLDALACAHLIQPTGIGRYGMHDLLRAYARELAAQDGQGDQDAALTRLFDHYLHTASVAMDTLYPAERNRRPRIPAPDLPAPPVAESAAAREWLDAQRATLVAVTVHAAGHGWAAHATRLAATLFRYLETGGHYPEALTIHSHARAAACHAGDRGAEAAALKDLAGVHHRQSRYQQATDHLQQALASLQQVGDLVTRGPALTNLGNVHYYQGRYREAIGLHRQALAIFGETGDPFGQANALNNLGFSEERLGCYDLAARHLRQALVVAAEIDDRPTKCIALVNLGTVGLRQGRYRQAIDHLNQGLALSREIGYRDAEAEALARIGDLHLQQGRPEEAARNLREALALYREIGRLSGEADVLNSLGEVLLATGQPEHARAEHDAALALAVRIGEKYQQARAHHGHGQACHADGDPEGASRHWQQALDLFTELGTHPKPDKSAPRRPAIDNNQPPDHRTNSLRPPGMHHPPGVRTGRRVRPTLPGPSTPERLGMGEKVQQAGTATGPEQRALIRA